MRKPLTREDITTAYEVLTRIKECDISTAREDAAIARVIKAAVAQLTIEDPRTA